MNQFDFALNDFGESDVRHAHAWASGNQRRTTAVELFDTLGDQIDQNKRVGDNFRGLIKEIAFHRRAGISRNRLCLLKRNHVRGEQSRLFFAQNNKWDSGSGNYAGPMVKPENLLLNKPYLVVCGSFSKPAGSEGSENADFIPEDADIIGAGLQLG